MSVIPDKQGKGIAKKILKSLEDYANKIDVTTILCKVRMRVPKNIQLYSSIGYDVYDEEVVHKPNGINIKVVSMKKELSTIGGNPTRSRDYPFFIEVKGSIPVMIKNGI
ncbi:GNAT family N-acetyltransferase [Bacillus solitudinis]|uniref:GNAT family N-acetyltransferase n=1 Tax=Bacillus solitudinis TaxID=2014074 RepID=UPI003872EB81